MSSSRSPTPPPPSSPLTFNVDIGTVTWTIGPVLQTPQSNVENEQTMDSCAKKLATYKKTIEKLILERRSTRREISNLTAKINKQSRRTDRMKQHFQLQHSRRRHLLYKNYETIARLHTDIADSTSAHAAEELTQDTQISLMGIEIEYLTRASEYDAHQRRVLDANKELLMTDIEMLSELNEDLRRENEGLKREAKAWEEERGVLVVREQQVRKLERRAGLAALAAKVHHREVERERRELMEESSERGETIEFLERERESWAGKAREAEEEVQRLREVMKWSGGGGSKERRCGDEDEDEEIEERVVKRGRCD